MPMKISQQNQVQFFDGIRQLLISFYCRQIFLKNKLWFLNFSYIL